MTGKKGLASLSITVLLLLAAAPVAHAQDLPDTGTVTDTANGATDTATDISGTTDSATGTIDETTDTVDDATGGATEGVTGTVDDTAGTAGDTASNVGNSVNNSTDGSGNNNHGGGSITDPVTNTVKNLTGIGGGNGGGATSGVTGLLDSGGNDTPDLRGLTPGLIDELLDEASNLGLSPVAAEGWIDGKTVYGAAAYQNPAMLLASLSGSLEDFASNVASGNSAGDGEVKFSATDSGSSRFANAGRAAVVAAKALAFPLALALGVLGFLMIQGRIGRKDPKLALAPVDTSEESLIFE